MAASVGMAPFTGRVYSVHERACNLAIGHRIRATVVTPGIGNVVQGLVVDVPAGFAFNRHVSAGMPVSCRCGLLRIGPGLTIETRGAAIWDDTVRQFTVDLKEDAQRLAWCEAWNTLGLGTAYPGRGLSLALDLNGITVVHKAITGVPCPPELDSACRSVALP